MQFNENTLEEYFKLAQDEPANFLGILANATEQDNSIENNPFFLSLRGLAHIHLAFLEYSANKDEWNNKSITFIENALTDIKKAIDAHSEIEGFFKDKMDAASIILDKKKPGRAQGILGFTKLKYFSERIFINNSCAEFLIPSDEAMNIFGEAKLIVPFIVRSAFVAYMQKDEKNRHYIKTALYEQPALKNAFGEVNPIKGMVDIFEDGTIVSESEKKEGPKKKGIFGRFRG